MSVCEILGKKVPLSVIMFLIFPSSNGDINNRMYGQFDSNGMKSESHTLNDLFLG